MGKRGLFLDGTLRLWYRVVLGRRGLTALVLWEVVGVGRVFGRGEVFGGVVVVVVREGRRGGVHHGARRLPRG